LQKQLDKMNIKISNRYIDEVTYNAERSVDWMTYKGESLKKWLINYCKRNKIPYDRGDTYTTLSFSSGPKFYAFLRIGNGHFPYFEFI
jgi:hypothetical protein